MFKTYNIFKKNPILELKFLKWINEAQINCNWPYICFLIQANNFKMHFYDWKEFLEPQQKKKKKKIRKKPSYMDDDISSDYWCK